MNLPKIFIIMLLSLSVMSCNEDKSQKEMGRSQVLDNSTSTGTQTGASTETKTDDSQTEDNNAPVVVAPDQNPPAPQQPQQPQQPPAPDNTVYTEDNCIDGQDLDAEDIDISRCPAIPSEPAAAQLGNTGKMISLGAWEIGQTAEGEVYKYGSLSEPGTNPRVLFYDENGSTTVNEGNITCWAKGYYRLRKILQNPPADYVKLRDHGFQFRFFQFQTDLRNGPTGFKEITSYMDHLVKWVTRIEKDGTCVQPTSGKFQKYLTAELIRRKL